MAKTIELEEDNFVFLNGEVNENSIGSIKKEIQILDIKLSSKKPIYLVLNTPGGSVGDGYELISVIRAMRHKVIAITKFAASMGFIISQATSERYILPHGILMSHRASGGSQGIFEGSLEVRLAFFKVVIGELEEMCASRMSLPLDKYKELIRDEYWVSGKQAVADKAADEVVDVRCSLSLLESNSCPL